MIGHRIREARQEAGLSQYRLGIAVDVTPPTIASWELGRAEPRASDLERIAAACAVRAAWLLTGEGPREAAQ